MASLQLPLRVRRVRRKVSLLLRRRRSSPLLHGNLSMLNVLGAYLLMMGKWLNIKSKVFPLQCRLIHTLASRFKRMLRGFSHLRMTEGVDGFAFMLMGLVRFGRRSRMATASL